MAPEALGSCPLAWPAPRLTAIRVGGFLVHRLAAQRQSLHLTPLRQAAVVQPRVDRPHQGATRVLVTRRLSEPILGHTEGT
jgi:hypothetical protein